MDSCGTQQEATPPKQCCSGCKLPCLRTELKQSATGRMRFLAQSLHGHGGTSQLFLPVLCFLGVLLLLLKLVTRRGGRGASKHGSVTFVPWEASTSIDSGDVIVVDCTHPKAPTFSHHKGHRNPHGLKVSWRCSAAMLADPCMINDVPGPLFPLRCRPQTRARALCSTHLQQTASLWLGRPLHTCDEIWSPPTTLT